MENLKGTDVCPCGSGLTYLECCADQVGGKWHKKDDGNIVKRIELPPELAEKLIEQRRLREQQLGRELNDEDKLFNITPEQFTNMFLESYFNTAPAEDLSFDPAIFYILLKEGLIFFEDQIPKLSTGDRMKILSVVEKYASSDNRVSLLEPFKVMLTPENYENLSVLFEMDDDDEETIMEDYMKLLINDSVIAAIEKLQAEMLRE